MKTASRAHGLGSFLAVLAAIVFAAPAHAAEDAAAVVARLYRDFAWEAVVTEPYTPGLAQQPASVLRRYFDEGMVARFLADRECVHKTNSVCRLDHAPLWASQDPAAYDLHVKPTQQPGVVDVEFSGPASPEPTRLRYELVRTSQGWRITDIRSDGGRASLRKQLEQP